MTRDDINHLVKVLREGLQPLVRDGLIDDERAWERARNQAAILMGEFIITLHRIDDGGAS